MHLYYQYQGGVSQDNKQDQARTPTAELSEASRQYPLEEIVDCFSQINMALPSNMAMHRLNGISSPQAEPPRSLPSGSQPYMSSQPTAGQNVQSWSRPASIASECDSFSYQGSPAPANTWLSPESSAVPSPQSCWSNMKQESVGTPQTWPASQQPLPSSYDISLYMSHQDVDNLHPGLRTYGSRSGTPSLQSRALHQGFVKDDFEDDDDPRDWNKDSDDARYDCQDGKQEEGSGSYAKLLRMALMGAPRHSMALKDIYQWFKEHTTKPGTEPESKENKGWTNSVRHNLSMNKAFVRRSRPTMPSDGQSKRVIYEWCLEPWALDDENFKSTTKYRNEDENGNPKKPSRPSRPKTKVANRSAAGRKGGLEAGRSRMAVKKAQQGLLSQDRMGLAQVEHSSYANSYHDFDRHQHYHQRSSSYPATGYGMPIHQGFSYEMQHQGYDQLPAHPSPDPSYSVPTMNSIYPMPDSDLSQQHPGPMYWQEQTGPTPYHA